MSDNLKEFVCLKKSAQALPDAVISDHGLMFPEVHTETDMMVKYALCIKDQHDHNHVNLPFCNTLGASIYGATINYGGADFGPRISECKYKTIGDLFDYLNSHTETLCNFSSDFSLTSNHYDLKVVNHFISALSSLSKTGASVAVNIEGPLTVLSALVEQRAIFKAFRKDPEKVHHIMGILSQNIARLTLASVKNGAQVISYADPVGTLDLLGPKVFNDLSAKYNADILNEIRDFGAVVHVCGKLSYGLEVKGHMTFEKVTPAHTTYIDNLFDPDISHTDSLYGHGCVGC